MVKYDLRTLGLGDGTYRITARSKAEGYKTSGESNEVLYVVGGSILEILNAPEILLDGDIIEITEIDERAETLVVVVDGVEMATVEAQKEEKYTVSGTWIFDELYNYEISAELPTQTVSFTSNEQSFTSIRGGSGGFFYDDLEVTTQYGDRFVFETHQEAYRTITFDGEQTVSKGFYEWLTTYAVKQADKEYTVNGTWYFNERVDRSPIFREHIVFTSNGVEFSQLDNDDIAGILYDDTTVYDRTIIPNEGWTNEAYRTITFEGTQTVSKEFYEWLTANAVTPYKVSGTWYFNEKINLERHNMQVNVQFISNGNLYKSLTIGGDSTHGYMYYGDTFVSSHTDSYISNTWEDNAYRTITFDGVQTVSKKFYEFLAFNAMRPVYGTWKFKEEIPNISYNPFEINARFKSGGKQWRLMYVYDTADGDIYYSEDNIENHATPDIRVADGGTWRKAEYQSITFDYTCYMEQGMYELFILDAVFAFTIDGTTYYAEEGMTWGEWVESEYNIDEYWVNIETISAKSSVHSNAHSVLYNDVPVNRNDVIRPLEYELSKGGN